MVSRKLTTLFMMLTAAFLVACPSSDEETKDTVGGQDTPTVETQADAIDDAPVTSVTLTGQLVDFKSKKPRQGVDLVVLNNETGEPLDLVKYPPFASGVDGRFSLTLPPGIEVGFKATGEEVPAPPPPLKAMKFQTTYMFNIPSDAQNKRIYAVDFITYKTAPAPAGIVVDDTMGIVAGTVYFKDPSTDEEQFVGCATVEVVPADGSSTEPMGVVRYFDPRNDMPASLENATQTTTGLAGTSRFIIANLPVGRYKLSAKIGGVVINTVEVKVHSNLDSISIANIYVTDPAGSGGNPTPARAECTVDEVDPS